MAADVRWLGHSAFHLSGGGADVLIDPFLTGNPKAAATADELPADVIALTHGHGDHLGDTVDIAKRTGAKVLAIVELAAEIEGDGVEDVVGFNYGGTVTFDWGWVKMVPGLAHRGLARRARAHMPAGLLIHYGGHLIYHLGDTALFSDLKLIAGRGDRVELALVPIGGHYTMDRFDAVTAVELDQPVPDDPDPLRHVPAGRDRRAGVQAGRPERRLLAKCSCSNPATRTRCDDPRRRPDRRRARRDLPTLGGQLADVEGVAEAYSVTGEWDFVAILRVRNPEEVAQVVTHRFAEIEGIERTQTMVAFEVFSQHDLEALFSIGN